jgi:hypothetical protein
MRFDSAATRAAYRRGAHDSYESAVLSLEAQTARAVKSWLNELDEWSDGQPPEPPCRWR